MRIPTFSWPRHRAIGRVAGWAAGALVACGAAQAAPAAPVTPVVSAPAAAAPHDAPAVVALGLTLFNDTRLSRDGKVSCASCHQASKAYSDGRPLAVGFRGQTGVRNAPSLLNVGTQTHFFWDGRRTALQDMVLDPLRNPQEHALGSIDELLTLLRRDPAYPARFAQAFPAAAGAGSRTAPDAISSDHVGMALAAYVRSLVSPESAIDRYLVRKQTDALSAQARRGYAVFTGQAGCAGCHSVTPDRTTGRVLFTDQQFHAHGHSLYAAEEGIRQYAQGLLQSGTPLAQVAASDPRSTAILGRFVVTGRYGDIGAFKTPSLRNVARTGPYFNDGSVDSLEQAVELELNIPMREILLSPGDKQALMAFLRALSDDGQ